MDNCPFCGSDNCEIGLDGSYYHINCNKSKPYLEAYVHQFINEGGSEDIKKRYNIICEFLLRHKKIHIQGDFHNYKFMFSEENAKINEISNDPTLINIAKFTKDYPDEAIDRIEESLVNLSYINNTIGAKITNIYERKNCIFYSLNRSESYEVKWIINTLKDYGYIYVDSFNPNNISITVKGWEKIKERKTKSLNQGFIAMAFDPKAECIYDAFYEAIKDSGYNPLKISNKEHNNQIVPEIFYEIQRSKFVVVDTTFPNLGAYYEAGYAEALGKQVIICCNKEQFENNPPHFDIAQKSSIIWEDIPELIDRLKRRIESTVGKN